MFHKPQPPSPPSIFDRIGDFYGSLNGWLQALILIGAAVGVLVTFFRWIKPRISSFFSDLRAIRDTLVGRPAMRDSISHRPIPGTALPSIGDRMASQETSMAKVADAVDKLAATTSRVSHLEDRVSRIEVALTDDRRLDKIESVQLLRTIETVAQAEPSAEPPEGTRPD